ncbi:protein turtle homolog B-like [Argiope bruennichi]|uniref:protein turtle homolog B-like n=1 Tax=Argiope bruennichi TaxID=94029 RepID=UPI00249476EC|nr:protein turtle homolog B-like [Argiope bruennichi]
MILWYRLDNPNPIYTLDIRKTTIKRAKHFPSPEVQERIHFDVSVHPPVLIITPVVPEDAEVYKCRVDLRKTRTLILQSRLKVIVPPHDPIIMDEYGQRLKGVIGPFDEGSTLTLICDVDGGNPHPSVTWWRDEVLVDDIFNVTTKGFVRNKLTVNKIRRSDLMAQYSCKASNTNLTKPKVESIHLDMNLLPLHVEIIDSNHPMLAGERYYIECQAKGSRPPAITRWWLGGNKITSGFSEEIDEENGNITTNTLQFVPIPEDDGRPLTCKAANPAIPKTTIETTLNLNIHFIPVVNLTVNGSSKNMDIIEDNYIHMECSISANPPVYDITWYFRKHTVRTIEPLGILITNQTLVIERAKREHNGSYHCSAENFVNRGTSNSIHLTIKYTPKCKRHDPQKFVISETETVNVSCDVYADPNNVSFLWSLENSEGIVILQNWSSLYVLNYSPVTDSGYGVIFCWGQNSVGIQESPCQFQLFAASIPDAPHSCIVSNLTLHSFSVECEAGYNGSLLQVFHLEVYSSKKEELKYNVTQVKSPTFKIDGLSPGTSYVLLVYSSNVKGASHSVALVATTLHPAERRTAQETQIVILWRILIGVIVIVFFLLSVNGLVLIARKLQDNADLSEENVRNSNEAEKKDLEEGADANEKGPDIIPQSADSEVFFMSGKLVEAPNTTDIETLPFEPRKYKHTVL